MGRRVVTLVVCRYLGYAGLGAFWAFWAVGLWEQPLHVKYIIHDITLPR